MKIKTLVYSTILSIISSYGYSQKTVFTTPEKLYESYSYVDAVSNYEKLAQKGYKDQNMLQKLGNSYYFNADLIKAEKCYSELFGISLEQAPEYYYRYSQTLKSIGEYDKANKMLDQFNKRSGNDTRAKLYKSNKNYLKDIKTNSGRYNIDNAGIINSKYSDYGTSFSANRLVFATARDTGGVSKKIFKWNNKSFTNLFAAELQSDGTLSKPKKLDKILNSKFHESTPVFTKDGETMYFTRNNYINGKKGKDSKKITLLKLYKATLQGKSWSHVSELPFNSDQYSVAHPALSPDGKTLYFASDMPGTLGQSDLYKVAINADGSYSQPINLGSAINTAGRETFPYVSEDNELYFASDGHQGLGGLDIFVSEIQKDGGFIVVQNVGAPVNGTQDDFAFFITKNRNGYFSSNRDGGYGSDDVYKLIETRKINCKQSLAGIITDQVTGEIQANSKVSLFDDKFRLIEESTTDDQGHYDFNADCGTVYFVRAEKAEFDINEKKIKIAQETGITDLLIKLEKINTHLGADLAKTESLKNIYFDLDKSFIRPDAAIELEKILAVMNQNPTMTIDVRSHTDSRQTALYNMILSDRRAKATIAWLVKNGIDAARLTGKGYGESELVNNCTDGVKCSQENHQANRRSEFIVTSL